MEREAGIKLTELENAVVDNDKDIKRLDNRQLRLVENQENIIIPSINKNKIMAIAGLILGSVALLWGIILGTKVFSIIGKLQEQKVKIYWDMPSLISDDQTSSYVEDEIKDITKELKAVSDDYMPKDNEEISIMECKEITPKDEKLEAIKNDIIKKQKQKKD